MYELHPILYEIKNDQYKNKSKRNRAFESILKEFITKFGSINVGVEDVRKKINALRTQFFAEMSKQKKSMVSGAGIEDVYMPKLWCFEQLSFLDSSTPCRKGESNLLHREDTVDSEEEHEVVFEGTIDELHNSDVQIEEELGPRSTTSMSFVSDISSASQTRKRHRKSDVELQDKSRAAHLLESATNLLESTQFSTTSNVDGIDAFAL